MLGAFVLLARGFRLAFAKGAWTCDGRPGCQRRWLRPGPEWDSERALAGEGEPGPPGQGPAPPP